MNRRGFLGAILAAGCAPAIVRAESLMRVRQLDSGILIPDMSFTSDDLAMSLDELSRRIIRPAMIQLCDNIDFQVMGLLR